MCIQLEEALRRESATGASVLSEKKIKSQLGWLLELPARLALHKGWKTWREMGAYQNMTSLKLSITPKVFARISKAYLFKGWKTWRDKVANQKVGSLKLGLARKAFARLSGATLSAAWTKWMLLVEEAAKKKVAMKHMIGRMLRLQEAKVWEAWSLAAGELREAEHVASKRATLTRRIVLRVSRSSLARDMTKWRLATRHDALPAQELTLPNADLVHLTLESQCRSQLRRITIRLANSALRKGWKTWRDKVANQKVGLLKLDVAQKALAGLSEASIRMDSDFLETARKLDQRIHRTRQGEIGPIEAKLRQSANPGPRELNFSEPKCPESPNDPTLGLEGSANPRATSQL